MFIRKNFQKEVDSDRHASEDITRVEHGFEPLREVIRNEEIRARRSRVFLEEL